MLNGIKCRPQRETVDDDVMHVKTQTQYNQMMQLDDVINALLVISFIVHVHFVRLIRANIRCLASL